MEVFEPPGAEAVFHRGVRVGGAPEGEAGEDALGDPVSLLQRVDCREVEERRLAEGVPDGVDDMVPPPPPPAASP